MPLLLISNMIFVLRHYIYNKKGTRRYLSVCINIYYLILSIFSLIFFVILSESFNGASDRKQIIKILNELSVKQKAYLIINGRYARSFGELNYKQETNGVGRVITLYINENKMGINERNSFPSYVKIQKGYTYAVHCFYSPTLERSCDTFSIDMNGNVETIESINSWFLPLPKWHEWK